MIKTKIPNTYRIWHNGINYLRLSPTLWYTYIEYSNSYIKALCPEKLEEMFSRETIIFREKYKDFFIIGSEKLENGTFRIKVNLEDDYAIHHGSFKSVQECIDYINRKF